MAKIIGIDEAIPDLETPWQVDDKHAYTGKRVEELIKNQLRSKPGYPYRTPEKQDDGFYHILFFENQDAFNKWNEDKDENAGLVLQDIALPPSGGSGTQTQTTYSVDLKTGSQQSGIIAMGGRVVILLRFTSQYYNPGETTPNDTGNGGVLIIQRRGSSSGAWAKVDERDIESLPADSTDWTEVDITSLLMDGTQQFRFLVRDSGNGLSTRWIAFQNVVKTQLGLTFATQWEKPITDGVIPLAFYIQGSVNKTLHVRISGDGGTRTLTYELGTTTYTETPWTQNVGDTATDTAKVTSHGIHNIEAWLTVGTNTESEHVRAQVFVRKDLTDQKAYMVINDVLEKVSNYTDATMFRYAVILPSGGTTNVHVKISDSTEKTSYGEAVLANRESGKRYDYAGMLEIESTAKTIAAYFNFTDDAGEKLADRVAIAVDNTENFAPTVGADFVLNPKMRSNEETDAKTITNDADGSKVDSRWTGFAMSAADGWTGGALVVPAGHEVDIDYEPFSGFMGSGNHTDSLTVEMDLKIDHVSDDEASLLRLCSFSQDGKTPVGLLLKGLQMVFMTVGKNNEGSQNVMLQEGVRTHIALNIVYNLSQSGVNYVRIFVNGKINREFSYSADDTFVQYVTENGETNQTSQGIRLGGQGADLTLYGMRIYKKALSSADVRQDSMSALPSAAAKVAFRDANAITGDNGLINYTKAREKYNTLLHTGPLPSYTNKNEYDNGVSLDIHIVGDPKHSGVMNNLSVKGQGSSSKGYWKWNQQYKGNDDTMFVSEDGQTTIKKGYQLDDTVPVAKKLVGKLNWASSMQSHKEGGTNMYNDLWKEVVGGNSITKTAGYENCRAAVKEKPFLFFHRENENEEPVFDGMMTFGPGKADKPTFWGDEDKFPDLLMIEGSDNGRPLTLCQVPWMDDEVTYSEGEEGWKYAGNISWDNDMGNLDSLHYFKDAFNQVFLHSVSIMPHEGGLSALNADKTQNKAVQYWITEDEGDNKKYDLFRYDYITETWVNASTHKTGGVYDRLNLNEQCGGIASGVDWEATNEEFIAKRAEWAHSADGLGKYFNIDDTLFENCLCKLIAASDNRCKNIYCYVDPITHLICWYQDDVDTIGPIDNVGQNRKKYYLEEHDSVANGVLKQGESGWNGSDNNLFNLLEAAYRIEVRQMMNKILTAMAKLCGSPEAFVQKYFFDVSEYFPAVAYNETARVLYEEAAAAMKAGKYDNATDPLSQSLGDNLECEKEWWKWRLIYMSSYCNYGQFVIRGNGSLFVRSILALDVQNPNYVFRLVPAKWLYISGFTGQALHWGKGFDQPQRAEPGKVFVLDDIIGDGNTDIGICGADYFSSFGNFGGISLGETFNLSGERLTEFSATSEGDMEFRPTAMTVNNCPVLRTFDVDGAATVGGTLDLKDASRLESVSAKGTGVNIVSLPQSASLKTVALGDKITDLTLGGSSLKTVTLDGYKSLGTLKLLGGLNKDFGVSDFLAACMQGGAVLTSLEWTDGTWTDPTSELVKYVTGITDLKLRGVKLVFATRNLTFDMKMQLIDAFGDIDNEANNVYAEYNKVAISSISISGQTFMSRIGKYSLSVRSEPIGGNDFKTVKWSIDNNTNAEIDQKGNVTVKSVSSAEEGAHGTVTCTATLDDGNEIKATLDLKFYVKEVSVGDYVFSDGSTSENKTSPTGLTAIGRCFYINPANKNDRRMVAINMSVSDCWGIIGNDNVKLADNPSYSTGDISILPNGVSANIEDMVGDIPTGKYYTKQIITHRNTVLKDSGINLPVPEEQAERGSGTPMNCLMDDLTQASLKGAAVRRYYYPAASLCYAYEPTIGKDEKLDDKFKAGQWYLPTTSELANIARLKLGDDYAWSSCEYNAEYAYCVTLSTGNASSSGKSNSYIVRAVAAF